MFGSSNDGEGGGRKSIVIATLKSVVVIGLISFAAANWLSSGALDRSGLGRLAQDVSRLDPLTTGSISGRAGATRLDPCAVPPR